MSLMSDKGKQFKGLKVKGWQEYSKLQISGVAIGGIAGTKNGEISNIMPNTFVQDQSRMRFDKLKDKDMRINIVPDQSRMRFDKLKDKDMRMNIVPDQSRMRFDKLKDKDMRMNIVPDQSRMRFDKLKDKDMRMNIVPDQSRMRFDKLKDKDMRMNIVPDQSRMRLDKLKDRDMRMNAGAEGTFLSVDLDMSISFNNLRISPYEVEHLLDVNIVQKINEHGTLYFKALLSDEKKDQYADNFAEKTNVVLNVAGEERDEFVLFQGVVRDVKVHAAQGEYFLEVHAVSYSYLLDIDKKSRSFQDKSKTYEQLAIQVTTAYPGAGLLDVVTNEAPTNKFIMQHMETDWEFLKRLASRFNTGLVSDSRFDKPVYYFGIPQMQSIELECFNYTVKKDMQRFKQLSENGVEDLIENDFIYYELETDRLVHIGDEVQFQNKKLYAAEITSTVYKGQFINYVVLTRKKGLSQLYQYHEKIVGGSFNGHIAEIQNDRVKVSLDADINHDPGALCFFPYSTIYSSQDGSGWYCMPEMGDTVRIYFPDGEEDHAYAISSVHEQVDPSLRQGTDSSRAGSGGGAGGYSGQRDDPNVKSLRTSTGKEIRLTPEGIYIITDGTTITLTDAEGVQIVSDNNIEFKSDKNIILSAEQDVNIVGTTGVDLMCSETASIKMKDNVEIVGQEVKSN